MKGISTIGANEGHNIKGLIFKASMAKVAVKQLLDFGEGKRVWFTLGRDLNFPSINLNNGGLHTLLLKCSNNLFFKVILDLSRGTILFVKGRGQIAIM